MTDWKTFTIGDCFDLEPGFAFKSSDFKDQGTPIIKIKNVKAGYFNESDFDYVDPIFLSARPKKVAQFGDLLISMSGNRHDGSAETWVGKVAPFRSRNPYLINQRVGALRIKSHGTVDPRFASFLLSSLPYQHTFIAIATSSGGQANLSPTQILTAEMLLPSFSEQLAISNILGSLDDKIELNRRMNETLEALAQAIFKDWFVDFGPTRRKAEGATDPIAILGSLIPDPARAAQTAALFPDTIGDDGLPEGWHDKGLNEVAEFLNGLALQKYPPTGKDDLAVIKIAELRSGISAKTDRANRSIADKYLIKDGDFLFSWSGSLLAKFWTEGEGALNQHLFKVSSETHPRWFYSQWVLHHMPEFQTIAASKATTMGHIQRGHLSAARVIVPPQPTLHAMTPIVEPIIERIIHNDLESRTLAETRDYLLPKLMSGEVRVRDAEKMVEGAGA